jgi:PIN domain nuclease of toxin-antitoxin system
MGQATRAAISDPANDVFVSVVSLWELTIKQRIGKLAVNVADVVAALPNEGFPVLGLTAEHLATLRALSSHHRDPFDQMLIAQALAEGATFISQDRVIGLYPVQLMRFSD